MSFYNRADDLELLGKAKVDQKDLFVIYYLVKTIEDNSENEELVYKALNVLLIPVVFAMHPENHSIDPEDFLETIKQLDISVYEYKIASVAMKYKKNNSLQNAARNVI